jgi:hypothetical protein
MLSSSERHPGAVERKNSEAVTMTLDFNLASIPSDPKAALGYAELYALWKADQEAFSEGRHISDAEYLIWMARARLHLTPEEKAFFDLSTKDNSVDEFRAEKAAALVKILMDRHGLQVAEVKGGLRPAS